MKNPYFFSIGISIVYFETQFKHTQGSFSKSMTIPKP
jgi:hypothetical protein